MGSSGLEPQTSCVSSKCSNQRYAAGVSLISPVFFSNFLDRWECIQAVDRRNYGDIIRITACIHIIDIGRGAVFECGCQRYYDREFKRLYVREQTQAQQRRQYFHDRPAQKAKYKWRPIGEVCLRWGAVNLDPGVATDPLSIPALKIAVDALERIERAVIRYGEDVGDQWIKEVAHAALEAVGSTLPR